VYQHFDAGHPHIHIVSLKVLADGSRIDTNNIGRNQSEKARKEIEKSFGLRRAEDSRQRQADELKPARIQKAQYGKSETKRAISDVLEVVLNEYKYTSLPGLNAVLQQYGVLAGRGSENSRVYLNRGLVYRIVDEQGNKIGVPVKASDFSGKPTLKYLEAKFQLHEAGCQPHKARVKNAIDLALLKNPGHSLQSLAQSLEREGIRAVFKSSKEGALYGITYVDHHTKCVFNGSDLGQQYGAKGLQQRCAGVAQRQHNAVNLPPPAGQQETPNQASDKEQTTAIGQAFISKVADALLPPTPSDEYLPNELKKNKKKKTKRISHHL
jgi:hypothetical protein